MRKLNSLSNIVLISAFCIFMLTIVPMCAFDRIGLGPEFSSVNNAPEALLEKPMFLPAQDEMPVRSDMDLVYDSESDRMIFFGGATSNLNPEYDDTWSYDYNTNTWTEMDPAVAPPASDVHAMAYHSGADRVVLFGGHVAGHATDWQNHDETWVYDLNTDTWTDMAPATAPEARCSHSMAYDSESEVIVLFGGSPDDWYTNTRMFSDTWLYNLTSNTWTNVTTGIHPPPRSWHTMAYDVESDLIVLFGGFHLVGGWTILNDTWTYDVDTNTWAEIDTEGPDSLGGMVYNSESDRVVFFGGALDMSELVQDLVSETWIYDTNTETWEMMSLDVQPDPRSRVRVTYDSESDRVLLFGGVIDGGWPTHEVLRGCWAYNLNGNFWNNMDWDWQEVTPEDSPEPTGDPAMAYDSESDLVVMFGGKVNSTYTETGFWGDNETWTYNYTSNTWTNMTPANSPPMRYGAGMVYDEESDVIIMYGGAGNNGTDYKSLNDTWAYDANTNTWTNLSPAVAPAARTDYYFYVYEGQQMTYDSKSDLVILFGPSNETWTYNYNSNTWTMMSPEKAPSARQSAVLVYDEESEVSVLYGGFGGGDAYFGIKYDTWVYNYTSDTWTEVSPSYSPSKRFGASAVYDSSAARIILFGGQGADELHDETWSYDYNTNSWIDMNSPNNPSERSDVGLAFDSDSNRTILFSGWHFTEPVARSDTYTYRYTINAPSAPTNLEVAASGDDLVLTWNAPVTHTEIPITAYRIYRGLSSSAYELLTEVGPVLTYSETVAPNTEFYYVVSAVTSVGESDVSEAASGMITKALPDDDGVFKFIAYGDTRSNDETAVSQWHAPIIQCYLQHEPELILNTGDLVLHGGESYQWPLFDASISAITDAEIPFYNCPGNHEHYTDVYGVNDEDFSTYLDYVDFSEVVDTPGETELYYSFDMEGIHFIFLNTVVEWDANTYTCPEGQMTWLMADLQATTAADVIVVSFHNPMYSIQAGRTDKWAQAGSLRNTFKDLFIQYDVDIVFNGHDHQYYRTYRDDIYYVVTGGGGAPLYDFATVGTIYQTGDVAAKGYHYCVGEVNATAVSFEVFLMNGTMIDSFSIAKPAPGIPIETVIVIVGVAGVVIVIAGVVIVKRRR